MKKVKYLFVGALLALAACGPADTNSAAGTAGAALGTAVPPAVASAAANAAAAIPSDIAAAAESAVNAAISSVPSDIAEQAAALLADAQLQQLASEAVSTISGLPSSNLKVQRDQPTVLGTTQEVADVTDYRWIMTQVPAGAEKVKGTLIAENSNGKLTVDPNDYAKYFPVAGDYIVTLELTFKDGHKERSPINLSIP